MIYSYHVRLARSALNLTQSELAEKSGVSAPTIKTIEQSEPYKELKNSRVIIMALERFFTDSGLIFIDEEEFIGVKIGKKIIKEMK
ncbi:helix-turn-helix domain-containing protein [Rickettsiales bacterium]|nr:helix-turn-helix domain-containing protein [Rickettsiales bacterium]MDB2550368.1 helix-turn-helix domain-containing protein [Rickettsiales bacterium]